MDISIVGTGATGSFIGSKLIQAGFGVSFVTSEQRRQEIVRHGLLVCTNDGVFQSRVRCRGQDETDQSDIVILTSRSHHSSIALAAAHTAIGPLTIVLPCFFDLISIQSLLEYGTGTSVGVVPECGVMQRHDGSIKQVGLPAIRIGALSPKAERQVETVRNLFDCAGFEVYQSADIRSDIWSAFALSASAAALMRLGNGSIDSAFASTRGRTFFTDLLCEAGRTGAKLGVGLEPSQVQQWQSQLHRPTWARFEPMRVDAKGSARAEAEHNLMVMVRHAQDVGMRAPSFERAYYGFSNHERKA